MPTSRGPFRLQLLVAGISWTLLSACSRDAVISKVDPPETDRFARASFETFRVGSPDEALGLLSPQAKELPGVADSVRSLQQKFGQLGVIDSATLVDAQYLWLKGLAPPRRTLMYELWGRQTLAVTRLVILEDGTQRSIAGVQIQPLTRSFESVNGFWSNASLAKLAVLLAAIGCAIFSLATALLVASTPMRRRWLWSLVALFGVASFSMSWTTGAVKVDLLSVQLLSAALQRIGLVGPWVVSVGFPIGAIVALRKRRQSLASNGKTIASAPVETDPASASEVREVTDAPDSVTLS